MNRALYALGLWDARGPRPRVGRPSALTNSSHKISKDPFGWMYSYRGNVPLGIHVICNKAKRIRKHLIAVAGEGDPEKYPAVWRQQMENELYSTDCC